MANGRMAVADTAQEILGRETIESSRSSSQLSQDEREFEQLIREIRRSEEMMGLEDGDSGR